MGDFDNGFGAGLGGLRKTCGALSGLAMLAGCKRGYPPGDVKAKNEFYAFIRKLEAEFADVLGHSDCHVILKNARVEPSAEASERTKEYYAMRPCERCVALADELYTKHLASKE